MEEMRDALERLRRRDVRTEQDAAVAAEASRILGEFIRLERRAEALVATLEGSGDERTDTLAGLTLHGAAQRVLQEAGVPLHAKELGARIKAGGWKHPRSERARPEQIVFQLAARLPRHPETFVRVAPNTFALTGWGTTTGGSRRQPQVGSFAARRPAASSVDDSGEPFERQPWRSS